MARSETKEPKRPRSKRAKAQSAITEESIVIPSDLPLLPIRDAVYFPRMIFPLFAGREKSIRSLDEAMARDRLILLVAQKQIVTDDPTPDDIYTVGVVAAIMQITKVPDGTVRLVLEGLERARIKRYLQTEPYFQVEIEPIETVEETSLEVEALMRSVVSQFEQIVNIGRSIPPEALVNILNITEPNKLADQITPY
ncbi:MAG: LON peptidase substrate-binding domain-containing protein, partial [Armatimonadetes bacterium]|nr:LON peptidase substrate-binding domain-containing protein [Armatimonadota bacterium]